MNENPPWKIVEQALKDKKAPCYWEIADDGAPLKCKSCGQAGPAKDMFYSLCPNGKVSVDHKNCIYPEWLDKATKMPGTM